MNLLHAAQTTPSLTSRGLLQVNVVSIQNNFPVTDATISISSKNNPETISNKFPSILPVRQSKFPFLLLPWITALIPMPQLLTPNMWFL